MGRKRRPKRRNLAFSALEAGDLQMLRLRLAEDPDLPFIRDLNGNSLLLAAIYRGDGEAIDLLREAAGPLPAAEAVALGDAERLRELLDAGEAKPDDEAPDGFGLLHLACMFGHRDVVELLLDRGARRDRVCGHRMGVRPVHSAAAGRQYGLVELLLVDVLGMDWSEVHKEAEELEHAVSDRLLDHLDRFLDYPSVDPHGDPIPDPSGRARERRKAGRPLREAPAGAKVEVVRVTDQSPAFLKTVTRLGLQPGARIQVVESDESLDTTTVRVGRRAVTLGARAVRNLIVRG